MPALRALTDILHQGLVWRGKGVSRAEQSGVPSGFAALDSELPGGGWPAGALTELLPEHVGIGEIRALGPALARLSQEGKWLVWISPPYLPYAPALQAAGIDLAKVMIVRTRIFQDTLWASEQSLQSGACGALLCWPHKVTFPQLRRLQIAAEGSQCLAFLFRHPLAARESSPAALRLHLQSIKGQLAVKILKRRGGPLAQPILLTPSPVIDKPLRAAIEDLHATETHALDSPVSAAPALGMPVARFIHG